MAVSIKAGNPYWRGKHSTINLLVIASLNLLRFILKILFVLTVITNNQKANSILSYNFFPQ
jgi:hypothetical protein